MTKQEFILEYALKNQAYPSEELLNQLSSCFENSNDTNIVSSESSTEDTSLDIFKDWDDYVSKTHRGQYVELVEDCKPSSGQYGTFPKGFTFRVGNNHNLKYKIKSDSKFISEKEGGFQYSYADEELIVHCKISTNKKESTIVKKVKYYVKQNMTRYNYQTKQHEIISVFERPIYERGYSYQI